MGDLLVAIVILAAASAGLLWTGLRLARRGKGRFALWVALVDVAFILWFSGKMYGTLQMARWVPLSSAIVLGNWIPLGAGQLAGVLLSVGQIPKWRRGALAAVILLLAWYSALDPLLGKPPPTCRSWWLDGVAKQSGPTSCGPPCARTLLRHCGIPCDDREMFRLCLTTAKGTPSLGLYRGLKIKTRGTGWHVAVICGSLEELRYVEHWPILLRVQLIEPIPVCAGSAKHSFPRKKLYHTVVMFGYTDDGQAEIGDPGYPLRGREKWPRDTLESHWAGEALYLVKAGRGSNAGQHQAAAR